MRTSRSKTKQTQLYRRWTWILSLCVALSGLFPHSGSATPKKTIRQHQSKTSQSKPSRRAIRRRFRRTLQQCRKIEQKNRRRRCIRQAQRKQRRSLRTLGSRKQILPRTVTESTETTLPNPSGLEAIPPPPGIPSGKFIAHLSRHSCEAFLKKHDIAFRSLDESRFKQIDFPIELLADINGVSIRHHGKTEAPTILDCRLALALYAATPLLRSIGVRILEHFSVYRPGAHVRSTKKLSGHAKGLAIDLAYFVFEDGTSINVLDDWDNAKRGQAPCAAHSNDTPSTALWRKLVCESFERGLFQVVLTPHHNRAHRNHVHLEVVPEVDWTYLR